MSTTLQSNYLEQIYYTRLSIQQNRYEIDDTENLLKNEQAKHLFKIVEIKCGVSFITTEEGIYLLSTKQISHRTQA